MLSNSNSYTTFYLLFSGFCGLCYGFVLLSSATGASGLPQTNAFEVGSGWIYDFKSTVLLNEKDETHKDVGFLISGIVSVNAVWGNTNLDRLLKFELQSPQLHIRSRKAPAPDGFVHHTSQLDALAITPFLIEWSRGKIQKILLQKDEPVSLANLKKGIASLFQFQVLDQEINETDASGHCHVTYTSTGPNTFIKSKSECTASDLIYNSNQDYILGTIIESSRTGNYELDDKSICIKSVVSWETHTMYLASNENVGNKIDTFQSLTLTENKTVGTIEANSFDEALDKFSSSSGTIFTQESLTTEREDLSTEDSKSFQIMVKENKENLKSKFVGTVQSAKVISRLVATGRNSNKEDIAKTLGLKKNKAILHQLYDILGYVQTEASHAAVMKKIHFDDPTHEELCERYLWALSIASQVNPDILTDLLKRHKQVTNIPEKVKETLVLTIASMAHRLSKLPIYERHIKVYRNVEEAILNGLDYAKAPDDRHIYLRALKNLKSEKTIPKLLEVAKNGTNKETVLAWKALQVFHPSVLSHEVINIAIKSFFELNKRQDSSARTLALDIIINSKPTDKLLKELLYILISGLKSFEVHQYLIQRLNMIADQDESFRKRINKIIKSDYRLNNYAVLAQKGLSTALSRKFLETPFSNGSLVTVQEIQRGIVRRGIVNVMLEKEDTSQEMFSLGIFSGGLSTFVSSDPEGSDEPATAGIELTVLGTQIRPFIFFSGQGELMGHVWSGTASEKTTAYQALAVVQDHLQYLRLGTGFMSILNLKGSTSFDLSGKVEISLWNRNAISLIEKTAGIIISGTIQVDTSFVKSQVEFSISMEPKLNLQADIAFYSSISLCMKLSQPDMLFRHNVFKIERIPGSKHRLRKVKYKKYTIPGRTYSLNKKNNEMCNIVE